jgi:hypothetical protein
MASAAQAAVAADGSGTSRPERAPSIPHLEQSNGVTHLIVNGKPFVMLAGEVHNSSSSSLAYMEPIWDRLQAGSLNTALCPLSWEQVEPEEGQFDLSLVDGLIKQASEHKMRLVFLWFGTWKNTYSTYAPGWVKTNPKHFPRSQLVPELLSGALSPFGEETCKADARAFAAVMRRIKQVDGKQHTVIAIQVENEVGILNGMRDVSPLANAAFAKSVPPALMDYLQAHRDNLTPWAKTAWIEKGAKTKGIWTEVFGDDAEEAFMGWYTAGYVGRVAAAGKQEYPLPMFANAWMARDSRGGGYPVGGPNHKTLDFWKAAAPSIDACAPDIGSGAGFRADCAKFHRSDNPLIVPETGVNGFNACYAVFQHNALCFSPFGIDYFSGGPMADAYAFLERAYPVIAPYQGTDKLIAVLQTGPDGKEVALSNYRVKITFNRPDPSAPAVPRPGEPAAAQPATPAEPARGFVLWLGANEYVVGGAGFTVQFGLPPGVSGVPGHKFDYEMDYLSDHEGTFEDGVWIPGRRLNGDEHNVPVTSDARFRGSVIRMGDTLGFRRVKLLSFN